ncbi:MAG: glycine-rich domain-containing protein [Candidatus Micrarchaeia archaeon]
MKKENAFANKTRLAMALLFAVFLSGIATAGSVIIQNGQVNASSSFNASNVLFVNPVTGYVGIGTATSTRPLQISTIQDANIRLQDTSGSAPAAYVEFYNDTTRWGYVGLGGHDDKMVIGTNIEKSLSFYTNNSPKMVLTADGKVGIGTTDPQAKLDVNGTLNAYAFTVNGSALAAGSNQWNTSGANIYNTTANVGIGTSSPMAALHVNGSASSFETRLQTTANNVLLNFRDRLGNYQVGVSSGFSTPSWYVYDATAGTTRLLIDGNGNVGIGTTSPAKKLDVAGDIQASGDVCANGTCLSYFSCPSGGTLKCTETVDAGSIVFKVTGVGSTTWSPPDGVTSVRYLIVGGGGGGATYEGGGGGGGGVLTGTVSVTAGTVYTITVGRGGLPAQNGQNTYFSPVGTALGGGGGVTFSSNGLSGGCGGGGGSSFYGYSGGTGTSGQGYNGGAGTSEGIDGGYGGGGGGAGGAGSSSSGGIGLASTITGTKVYYAGGGGGGGNWNLATGSSNGLGGGGHGGGLNNDAKNGTNGLGGGGGGAGFVAVGSGGAWPAAFGGSGLVILRYNVP